ncbi:hemerythrin domain-containing protein [Numidum massiliense]|uniref:hemerythrin domain-containing protein n=1 Tax=Numidum massiliense TaxID=1522315 RepID=UPI0021C3347A|nr:hemerythrin domain-containing protein [Numidum massiliense]
MSSVTKGQLFFCDEETDVFPHIVAYEQAPTAAKLTALRQTIVDRESEHAATGDILKQIRAMTDGFEPPQGACTTYRATYGRLAELEADLFQHLHLENNILFLRYTQA